MVKNKEITRQQKKFADEFLLSRGNRIDAYYVAGYKAKNRLVASAAAAQLLKNIKVQDYINSKLKEMGFDDENVDLQLLFLINQHADFSAKVRAIDVYNKKSGKYTERHIHKFEGVGDEALKERLANIVTGSDGDSGGVEDPTTRE